MANNFTSANTIFAEAFVEVGATTASMTALGSTRNTEVSTERRKTPFYSPHTKAKYGFGDIEVMHSFQFVIEELTLHQLARLMYGYPMTNLTPASPNTTDLNLNAADEKAMAVRITGKDQGGNDRTWEFDEAYTAGSRSYQITIEREGVHQVECAFEAVGNNTGDFGDLTQIQTETLPTGWTGI
jgi:hypothetical protein